MADKHSLSEPSNYQSPNNDLETQIHNIMQTIRYKMHALMDHWNTANSTNASKTARNSPQNNMHEWLRIIDNHMFRINQLLDTALRANGLEFKPSDFESLETEYHKKLFGMVASTNPIWLSMLMLLSNQQNDTQLEHQKQHLNNDETGNTVNSKFTKNGGVSEQKKHLDTFFATATYNSNRLNLETPSINIISGISTTNTQCDIDALVTDDIENDYNNGPDSEWNWWGDWELVSHDMARYSNMEIAIKKSKIKID